MGEIVIRDNVPFPEITTKRGKPATPESLAMKGLKLGQSFETGPFSHKEAKEQSKILSGNAANLHRRKDFNKKWRLRTAMRFVKGTGEYFVGVWCVDKDSFKNKTNSTTGKNYGREKC